MKKIFFTFLSSCLPFMAYAENDNTEPLLTLSNDGQLILNCPQGYAYGLPEQHINIKTLSTENNLLGRSKNAYIVHIQTDFENQQHENADLKFTCVPMPQK